jgi:Cd2+/Zn2+-exporting ATPase
MKKILKVTGIDCANCAAALEREINKLDCVNDAKLNFLMGKLTLDIKDEASLDAVVKLIEDEEPDAEVEGL